MFCLRLLWVATVAVALAGCRRPPPTKLDVGMWYWNSPFTLTDADRSDLSEIGVTTLYVREATFTTDGQRLLTEFHEHWQSPAQGMRIVLVYNFDAGVVRHFSAIPADTIAQDVSDGIAATSKLVRSHGIEPGGVQLDLDCPTRLLGKYADVLTQVRRELTSRGTIGPGQSYSATGLQTWLTNAHYSDVADAVDFMAPQFYEGRTGQSVKHVAPIADISSLGRGLSRADGFGRPFYAGVGAYGHALLYDANGHLTSIYHGLRPSDALRHTSLAGNEPVPLADDGSTADRRSYAGEELLELRAIKPDQHGKGVGDTLAYLIPSPLMVTKQLEAVRAARASNCRGVILYRFPSPQDELAVPLGALAATMKGRAATPSVSGSLVARAEPWSLISSDNRAPVPMSYAVSLTNRGAGPTAIGPNAVVALVHFSGLGLDSCQIGDFDEALVGMLGPDDRFRVCAPAEADALLLRKYRLGPGETVRSGAIYPLRSSKADRLRWRISGDAGLESFDGSVGVSSGRPSLKGAGA